MNADPLQVPPRVSYRTGMLLDASDFTDEQSYHRQRLAEVLARLHGTGTVAGLRVLPIRKGDPLPGGKQEEEDRIKVEPGFAIDRRGRMVEVTSARCLRLSRWFDSVAAAGPLVLKPLTSPPAQRWLVGDIFLRYLEAPQGLRPSFPEPGADATDAVVAARLNDSFELLLAPRSSEKAGVPPPLPKRPFQPAPTTREELLNAVYDAYTPSEPDEYPVTPMDSTPAGTPATKLADKTAVFLARVLIRLADAPAVDLARHASNEFQLQDAGRQVSPTAALLFALTPLA